jgi:hypothetical protein
MRFYSLIKVLFLIALALTAVRLSAVEAGPRMEAFKRELAVLRAEVKAKFPAVQENPPAAMAFTRKIMGKLQAVNTEGLPEDLRAGWEALSAHTRKFSALTKDWPEDASKWQAFIKNKEKAEPEYMERLGEQMLKLSEESGDVMDKLESLGEKYAFDVTGLIPGQAAAQELN